MVNQRTNNYAKNRNSFRYGNSYKKPNYKREDSKFFKPNKTNFVKSPKVKLAKLAIVSGGTGGIFFLPKFWLIIYKVVTTKYKFY